MQRLPDGRQSRPQRRQPRADGGRRAGRRGSAEESRRPCARRHVLDRWFGELVQPDKLVHRGALGTYRGWLLIDGVTVETIAALTGEKQTGTASGRQRVCRYVKEPGAAVSLPTQIVYNTKSNY